MRTTQGNEPDDPIEVLKGQMAGLRFLFDAQKLKQLIDAAAAEHNREKDYDRMTEDDLTWWGEWTKEVQRAKRSQAAL